MYIQLPIVFFDCTINSKTSQTPIILASAILKMLGNGFMPIKNKYSKNGFNMHQLDY